MVHVTESHNTDVLNFQAAHALDVILAPPTETDDAHADGIVGARYPAPGVSWQGERARRDGAVL